MKPRPDAKLKTLPDAAQAALYALYQKKSGAECLAWLDEAHGIKSSTGALSAFAGWYPFSRPLEMVATRARAFQVALKDDPKLKLNAEQVSLAGQIAFEQLALEAGNVEGFINLRKLRLKEVDQQHDARRIALLEKKAAQAEAAEGVTRDDTLTPQERDARLREIFGLRPAQTAA